MMTSTFEQRNFARTQAHTHTATATACQTCQMELSALRIIFDEPNYELYVYITVYSANSRCKHTPTTIFDSPKIKMRTFTIAVPKPNEGKNHVQIEKKYFASSSFFL